MYWQPLADNDLQQSSSLFYLKIRAGNNSRSTDNVRHDWGFDLSLRCVGVNVQQCLLEWDWGETLFCVACTMDRVRAFDTSLLSHAFGTLALTLLHVKIHSVGPKFVVQVAIQQQCSMKKGVSCCAGQRGALILCIKIYVASHLDQQPWGSYFQLCKTPLDLDLSCLLLLWIPEYY